MSTQISNRHIFAVASSLIIGFVAGALLFSNSVFPPTQNPSGDISKVARFGQNILTPEQNAFCDRLKSDTLLFAGIIQSIDALREQAEYYSKLVDRSVLAAGQWSDLTKVAAVLQITKSRSENVIIYAEQAKELLNQIVAGDKSLVPKYEMTADAMWNNHLALSHDNGVWKNYIKAIDHFLDGKPADKYQELATTRQLWASFCATDAALRQDESDMALWAEAEPILSAKEIASIINIDTDHINIY